MHLICSRAGDPEMVAHALPGPDKSLGANLVRRAPMNDEIRVIADGDDHNPWDLLIWAAPLFFSFDEGMKDDIHNLSPASNPLEEGEPMRIFIAAAALSFALISAATQFP